MDTVFEFLKKLFDSNDFTPRWMCGKWTEFHGWLYITSSIVIWAAYFTIPVLLFYFILKRKDVPFQRIFIWFILFILFCGATHLTDAVIFWFPFYRFNAILLSITAIISWITVWELFRNMYKAFDLKSPEQLKTIIAEQTSKLKEANKKIMESERQFKALIDNNPDIITRISKNLEYKFVNKAMSKLGKYEREYYVGKTPAETALGRETSEIYIKNVKEVFSTGRSISYETKVKTHNSTDKYFLVEVIPLFDSEGIEIEDVLTIAKDITEQKDNEKWLKNTINNLDTFSKRLEYKKRILEDFAYIVSHNLRSPVGNLSALLTLYETEENEQIKNMLLGKVKEVSERLSSTVNDLTEVVKIRQNTEVEKETLSFEVILKNQMASISAKIIESDAEITYDFSGCENIDYPRIYLESIVLNLLTNAIKYRVPGQKPIIHFLSVKDDNGIISMSCKDNGLGIDLKKHGHKIFGLHKTFHEHPDSKGVGLFITKNQVESQGGSIMLESEPNAGSKFIVTFNDHVH